MNRSDHPLPVGYRPLGDNRLSPPPSPEEIAERCAEIRAEWTAATRLSRMNPKFRPISWVVPGASASERGNDE